MSKITILTLTVVFLSTSFLPGCNRNTEPTYSDHNPPPIVMKVKVVINDQSISFAEMEFGTPDPNAKGIKIVHDDPSLTEVRVGMFTKQGCTMTTQIEAKVKSTGQSTLQPNITDTLYTPDDYQEGDKYVLLVWLPGEMEEQRYYGPFTSTPKEVRLEPNTFDRVSVLILLEDGKLHANSPTTIEEARKILQ